MQILVLWVLWNIIDKDCQCNIFTLQWLYELSLYLCRPASSDALEALLSSPDSQEPERAPCIPSFHHTEPDYVWWHPLCQRDAGRFMRRRGPWLLEPIGVFVTFLSINISRCWLPVRCACWQTHYNNEKWKFRKVWLSLQEERRQFAAVESG